MSDKINVLISEEDVEKRIQEIGTAISKEYEGKCVHLSHANWQKELPYR